MQFKDFLLVIKQNKMVFYAVEVKLNLNLEFLSICNDRDNLPFVPSHPYPFNLIYNETPIVISK